MRRRTFLKLAAIAPTFLYISCDKRPLDAKFEKATNTSFDYLEVSGSYYDIGYAIGKHCGKNIRAVMERRKKWLRHVREIETGPGREFSQAMYDKMEKVFPNYLLELKGMAEGSKIDFRTLWTMSIKSELGAFEKENPGCSTIYYKNGDSNWLFHNEDGQDAYRGEMLVLKATPPSDVTFVTLVYPGIIAGVGPSINQHGIIESTNYIGCKKPGSGIPRYFLGRAVLESESLDEAVKIATMEPRAHPWHHNLGSMKTGEYVSVETLPDGTVATRRPEGIYLHTNHTTHPKTKDYKHQDLEYKNSSSISRYNVLSEKIEQSGGKVDKPGEILGWLSSHQSKPYSPCRHPQGDINGRTLATAFFDFGRQSMKLYKGNPCEAVPNNAFEEYKF
jgi:predicted choloylglycine hydrolase